MNERLQDLGLEELNPAAWAGKDGWLPGADQKVLDSINPATGEVIARVGSASAEDYEKVIGQAQQAFLEWRSVPAPKRGEAVRLIGEELRKFKDPLGSLVSMEMGKIKAEGDG